MARRARSIAPGNHRSHGPACIKVRAGLHTGEVERTEVDVLGIASSRGAHHGYGKRGRRGHFETIKDLVAGSGIEFDNAGEHS